MRKLFILFMACLLALPFGFAQLEILGSTDSFTDSVINLESNITSSVSGGGNSSSNETYFNTKYWRLDGTNANQLSADWDMQSFWSFLHVAGINMIDDAVINLGNANIGKLFFNSSTGRTVLRGNNNLNGSLSSNIYLDENINLQSGALGNIYLNSSVIARDIFSVGTLDINTTNARDVPNIRLSQEDGQGSNVIEYYLDSLDANELGWSIDPSATMLTSMVYPRLNNVFDIGSTTLKYANGYFSNTLFTSIVNATNLTVNTVNVTGKPVSRTSWFNSPLTVNSQGFTGTDFDIFAVGYLGPKFEVTTDGNAYLKNNLNSSSISTKTISSENGNLAFSVLPTYLGVNFALANETSDIERNKKNSFAEVKFGNGNGNQPNLNISLLDFDLIPFSTLSGYSLTNTGNNYNATSNLYNVPFNGTYLIQTKLRITDAFTEGTSYGIGADTVAQDSPNFMWCETVLNRNGCYNQRISHFTKNEGIEMITYSDDELTTASDGSMTIVLLYQD